MVAHWSYTKNGRKIGIGFGLLQAILLAGCWWGFGSHTAVGICLALFIANGLVAFWNYVGRSLDTYYKSKAKNASQRNLIVIGLVATLALGIGLYAILTQAPVIHQFAALPSGLLYAFFTLNAIASITSFMSRWLDDNRPPTLKSCIKIGTVSGFVVGFGACTFTWGYYKLDPIDFIAQIGNNAHGTSGLLFGPIGTVHGTILAMLSFVIMGASVAEYWGKMRLWNKYCIEYSWQGVKKTQDCAHYTSLPPGAREAWLEQNFRHDPDKKTALACFNDFGGAVVGCFLIGPAIGIIFVIYCPAPPTLGGICLRILELVYTAFTAAALCSRTMSLKDGWICEPEVNAEETQSLTADGLSQSSSWSRLPTSVIKPALGKTLTSEAPIGEEEHASPASQPPSPQSNPSPPSHPPLSPSS